MENKPFGRAIQASPANTFLVWIATSLRSSQDDMGALRSSFSGRLQF